jgi:hypothetical protein
MPTVTRQENLIGQEFSAQRRQAVDPSIDNVVQRKLAFYGGHCR